jgi:hypothetical protein
MTRRVDRLGIAQRGIGQCGRPGEWHGVNRRGRLGEWLGGRHGRRRRRATRWRRRRGLSPLQRGHDRGGGAGTGATGALPTALTGATDRVTGLAGAPRADATRRRRPGCSEALAAAEAYLGTQPKRWITLLGWALTRSLGGVVDPEHAADVSRTWFDEWLLGRSLQRSAVEMGVEQEAAMLASGLARGAVAEERVALGRWRSGGAVRDGSAARDGDVQEFLRVNRYRDVLWFDKDASRSWRRRC